jgi:hypothetical protein
MARRNESFMSPAALEAAGQTIFGDNWRAAMADYLECDPSLIWRYMTVKVPVPKTFAVAVEALATLRQNAMALPTVTALDSVPEPIARAYEKRPKITRAEAMARIAKRRQERS